MLGRGAILSGSRNNYVTILRHTRVCLFVCLFPFNELVKLSHSFLSMYFLKRIFICDSLGPQEKSVGLI